MGRGIWRGRCLGPLSEQHELPELSSFSEKYLSLRFAPSEIDAHPTKFIPMLLEGVLIVT